MCVSVFLGCFIFFNAFGIINVGIRVVRVAVTVRLDQNKAGGSGFLFVPQLVASTLGSPEQ